MYSNRRAPPLRKRTVYMHQLTLHINKQRFLLHQWTVYIPRAQILPILLNFFAPYTIASQVINRRGTSIVGRSISMNGRCTSIDDPRAQILPILLGFFAPYKIASLVPAFVSAPPLRPSELRVSRYAIAASLGSADCS